VALARWAQLEIDSTKLFEDARASLTQGRSVEDELASFLKKDPGIRLKKLPANREGLAEQLSALYLSGLADDYAARENQQRWLNAEEPAALTREVDEVLALIKDAVVSSDVSWFVPVVEQLSMMRGYQLIDDSGEDLQRLTYRFLRAAQTGCEILAKRQRGEFADSPDLATPVLPAAWESDVRPASKKLSAPKLSAVTPLYKKQLETKDAKSQSTSMSWWMRFAEFCKDKPLAEVSTSDVFSFFEHRLNAEVKPWTMGYSSLVRRGLGEAFAIAKTMGLCAHNPALELEVMPKIRASEEKKRGKPRYPYSVPQLNILFKSDWYDPASTNWRGKMKLDLGARYWVPLLCLYHGFRIREPLQLSVSDIVIEDVALLKIQAEESQEDEAGLPEKRLKNDATKRTVPIHPTLLELGFLSFVEGARARGPNSPLFPSSVPEKGSQRPMWGRAYEQRFVPLVRDTLGFGPGFGNHSFRHTLEDCVRDTQYRSGTWPAGLVPFYTGRLLPRAEDRGIILEVGSEVDYGNRGNPNLMLPWIARIHYPGLELPDQFDFWLDGRPAVDPNLIVQLDHEWGGAWRG
jgi:integrase